MARRSKIVKKSKKHLVVIIGIITAVVFATVIFLLTIVVNNTSRYYKYGGWLDVKFDSKWTSEELRKWHLFLDQSLPEIENYLGRPPYVIKIKISPGEFVDKNYPKDTYGGKFNPKLEYQETFCPSPYKNQSICLHELVHQFYQGHIPRPLMFREGVPIYLQKIIGDKLGFNINNPEASEYFYTLTDNFETVDRWEFGTYGKKDPILNESMSRLQPICNIQYGLYGYQWKKLVDKDPDILKKFSAILWKTDSDTYKKLGISEEKCLDIMDALSPEFRFWFRNSKSLNGNNISGMRFAAISWPTPKDLAIIHWETRYNHKLQGMEERPFELNKATINIIKDKETVYTTYTDLQNGHVVMFGFLEEMRLRYGSNLIISVESGGKPNLIDKLVLK